MSFSCPFCPCFRYFTGWVSRRCSLDLFHCSWSSSTWFGLCLAGKCTRIRDRHCRFAHDALTFSARLHRECWICCSLGAGLARLVSRSLSFLIFLRFKGGIYIPFAPKALALYASGLSFLSLFCRSSNRNPLLCLALPFLLKCRWSLVKMNTLSFAFFLVQTWHLGYVSPLLPSFSCLFGTSSLHNLESREVSRKLDLRWWCSYCRCISCFNFGVSFSGFAKKKIFVCGGCSGVSPSFGTGP